MKYIYKLLLPCAVLTVAATGFTQSAFFNYTGGDQTWTVPAGMYRLLIHAWGAGGGCAGGSGAGASGVLNVEPGQVFTVVVGQAGGSGVYYNLGLGGRTYGGGGSAVGISDVKAAAGGGRTALILNGIEIFSAAGGGGGVAVTIGAHAWYGGGFGGIEIGGNGQGVGGGTGATQFVGGPVSGGPYQGGDPSGPGAGGGGGRFGGGGGSMASVPMYALYAGGGGSSLISNLNNVVAEQGRAGNSSSVLPGLVTDPYYQPGIGVGGGAQQQGGNGLLVLEAAPVPEPVSCLSLLSGIGLLVLRRKRR